MSHRLVRTHVSKENTHALPATADFTIGYLLVLRRPNRYKSRRSGILEDTSSFFVLPGPRGRLVQVVLKNGSTSLTCGPFGVRRPRAFFLVRCRSCQSIKSGARRRLWAAGCRLRKSYMNPIDTPFSSFARDASSSPFVLLPLLFLGRHVVVVYSQSSSVLVIGSAEGARCL